MADSRLLDPEPSPALPPWARAVDLLCLLMVIVAVLIAMSGGFRSHIGGWHFGATSPYRVLMWAALAGVVRHLLAPQQPVYRHLPGRIARWVRSTPLRTAFIVFVGTRPAIFLAGYLAVFLFGYAPGSAPIRSSDNELLNLPVRWDTGWYLQISADGYAYKPALGASRQQNIVFFPAFPLMTRVGAWLLGNAKLSYVFAGLFVSLAAFLIGLVYMFMLAREELSEEQSTAALWLLAAYPFALFYGAVYTESLFLASAAGAFYHLGRREHLGAAAWGLIAGLTRPNGFLLSVPLAIVALSPWLPGIVIRSRPHRDWRDGHDRSVRTLAPALLAASAPCVGMLVYSAFIWSLTGRPFAWAEGHEAWGRHYEGFATLIVDRYNFISQAGFLAYVSELPLDLLNGLGVLFVLGTTWPVARRLGLAYAVFILINMLPPLAVGGLMSAGRFSSVLFPSFIWMAAAVPARHRAGWAISFAAIQAFNAALHYTWRPLF